MPLLKLVIHLGKFLGVHLVDLKSRDTMPYVSYLLESVKLCAVNLSSLSVWEYGHGDSVSGDREGN